MNDSKWLIWGPNQIKKRAYDNKIKDIKLFSEAATKDLSFEFIRVERTCYHALCSLCTISSSKAVLGYLASPALLTLLFTVLRNGSPRMQRVVSRTLGAILPGVDVGMIEECGVAKSCGANGR